MSRELKGLAALKDELVAARASRIAERERLLAEREKLLMDLEDRNAELERFVYTMSHDLENPLVQPPTRTAAAVECFKLRASARRSLSPASPRPWR